MKIKNKGFTMVELLTVLAIVALLLGVLLPALTTVRNTAKETKQKAQFATIDLAILTFKNDDGDYPRSDWSFFPVEQRDYCGAQKLAEALLGWDLLGFHPKSIWDSAGTAYGSDPNDSNLGERKGPYLELSTANTFRLGNDPPNRPGLFNSTNYGGGQLARDTFVLCDVFGVRQIILPNGQAVKAGTPILYYRANTSSKSMEPTNFDQQIYSAYNNLPLILLGKLPYPERSPIPRGQQHKLGGDGSYFYDTEYKIIDPKVTARDWPHRPNSYILISAGVDGEYGTPDDITNF